MTAERQPGYIEATAAAQRDLQKRIRTVVPGTVVAYEPTTRRATIQPGPSLVTGGREGRPLPPLPAVPVAFPGGGGIGLSWGLRPGDRVTLYVFDRSIDRWLRGEVTYVPNSGRMHSLSDAMAVPEAPVPSPGEATDFVLTTDVGGEALRVTPLGAVSLAGVGEPAARVGDEVVVGADLASWLGLLTTYVNTLAPGTLPSVPTVAGTISTGSTRVTIG